MKNNLEINNDMEKLSELKPVLFEQPTKGKYHVMIVNPDDSSLVEVDVWKKDKDPERALLVAIIRNETNEVLLVSKALTEKEYEFDEAQAIAAAFTGGLEGVPFRCPTRREVLDIFDAELDGFDEAVRLIAGRNDWYNTWGWTCEKPRWWAQRYSANYAWIFNGASRNLNNYSVYSAYQVGAVTLLKFK